MSEETILVADDDKAIRTVVTQALGRLGYDVRATGNAATLWHWVSEGEGDLVITDVIMPDGNGLDLIPQIRKQRPELRVIAMSAQNTLLTAVKATERGAFEYLPKPFDLSDLVEAVRRALAAPTKGDRAESAQEEREDLPLIGRSQAMQEVYRVIARLTGTDLTALITGESGTGKELVARALHDFSRRRYAGRFEQAQGGSLFLDEIGDMPFEAQTRLLRVLQEGEYTTVGGRQAIKTDVRIIAATHRDLRQLVTQGRFREDLYYRLNVVPIRLPPLRERREDVPDLVRHFLGQALDAGLDQKTLTTAAMDRLSQYRWPGNVRELENLVRRLTALYAEDTIDVDVIEAELAERVGEEGGDGAGPGGGGAEDESLSDAVERTLKRYFAAHGEALPSNGLHERVLAEVERPLIALCLDATRGNQIKAAELLGLNRNTLRKKIRALDIPVVRGGRNG